MLPVRALAFTAVAVAAAAFGSPVRAQSPACMNEIVPMRQALETEGKSVKALFDKKAEPSAICAQLKRFVAAETKFVKYVETNQGWCGIPPEAVQQLKGSQKQSASLRDRACKAAASPKAIPAGPGLSEALGTARGPTTGSATAGRGTYETLTGNPFAR